MHLADYLRDVLVPANVAVAAIQRAGLPIDLKRLRWQRTEWERELRDLERYVEGEAAKAKTPFKYSPKHSVHPPYIAKFLFSGLGLKSEGETDTGNPSTDGEYLAEYASLRVPRPTDNPIVTAILQIRSLGGGIGKYLNGFEETLRADGCCHPNFSWALRTSRLSASKPPVHQIPERAEKIVPDGVKACIVPRVAPAQNRDDWDPRKHGSCWRWDISGAEAAGRAAMLTELYGVRDPVAWDYIRQGKDIHSKTASLIYNVPEGTYLKGTSERDDVGKQTFFAKLYGARWRTVQWTIWKKARRRITDDQAKAISANFDRGYSGITQLYEIDRQMLGERLDSTGLSWCEDAYGRRRAIEVPKGARSKFQLRSGWDADLDSPWLGLPYGVKVPEEKWLLRARLNHAFHVMANTPTQSNNASDTLWMLALCHAGEYVELRVPPMWERDGVLFPEAKDWQLNGGRGPGGTPFQSWHMNTVHDSGWGDCAPGYLEPTAKLLWRRCQALPMDWRLKADVPYRIDLKVGPDMSRLRDYNKVAKEFNLEPVPER